MMTAPVPTRFDGALLVPLCRVAAGVLGRARAEQTRPADGLSEALRRPKRGAEQAEVLSALVYGVLRNERRLEAALAAAARGPTINAPVTEVKRALSLVVGFAVLGGWLGPRDAGALVPNVVWSRFAQAEAGLWSALTAEETVRRVALRGSLPDWLAERLLVEYGDEAEALARSLAQAPARSLRANTLRGETTALARALADEGAITEPSALTPLGLRLQGAVNPFLTRAFHAGAFELQDESSQIVAELLAPPPGGLVVDACAGAGGKALALAAMLRGRGRVVALDIDAHRLGELRRRAKRAGAVNVQALAIASDGPFPPAVEQLAGKVDRLLVDAPCSGTGVLRRNPELRRTITPEVTARLAAEQLAIASRMVPLLAEGGRLLFATCSLLAEEGEQVMDALEAAHPALRPMDLAEVHGRAFVDRFVRSAPHRLRILPHRNDSDGFFIAALRRPR